MSKFLLGYLLTGLLTSYALAKAEVQENLRFNIAIEKLMKGNIHYAVEILTPSTLEKKYPELYEMDTLGVLDEKDAVVLVGKSVQVVKRPAGFFDHRTLSDQKFMQFVLGQQKVIKEKDSVFKVKIHEGPSYRIRAYFDSDDISTLPNSRVIRAVTQAKKMDVISQGATSTQVKEFIDFSSEAHGGVTVSSFIPLKEEKTLMVTYNLMVIKGPLKDKPALKINFVEEILATKDLIEKFR